MSNVFLPGELIGLLRVERMRRALEEAICFRAILLGIREHLWSLKVLYLKQVFKKLLEF
ncbi:hypothetical protein Golax_018547 [Gossypium laxum]|uniref:Uncharacterized protein n=1 Tax=Gossypium laxum TaxID=34288 RepID=A0A7J8Z3P3_9ROSI|nr:hypothetical protein [Gossypium laxum]